MATAIKSSNRSNEDADTVTGKRPWPWNPLQAIVIAAVIFITSQFAAFAIVAVVAGIYGQIAGWTGERFNQWLVETTLAKFLLIVTAEVLAVLGIRWILRRRAISMKAIGFSRPTLRDFWLPFVAFGLYFSFFIMLVAVLRQFVPGLDVDQKQDIGFDGASGFWPLLMIFVALVICAPVAEEVLFRGFLFTSLRRHTKFWLATVLTSLLFGAAHLAGGEPGASLLWIAGIDTLLLSFALCYLRESTGRLWAPIILHAIKNGLAFTLLFIVAA